MSERDDIVTNPSVTHDNPSVKLRDETAPVYRAGEQATETGIDMDAMLREIKRRLHSLEAVEAENRALRYQLSAAHCQVAAATKLLRLLLEHYQGVGNEDSEIDTALVEYQARFGQL